MNIYNKDPIKQINTYFEAVSSVDAIKATGKSYSLWCSFAKFYEQKKDLHNARIVFKKAMIQPYLWSADLSNGYCEWVEMELRNKNRKNSLILLQTILGLSDYHDINMRVKNQKI